MCAVVLLGVLMAVPSSVICVANPVAIQSPPETVLDIGYAQVIDSLNPFMGLNDMSHVFYGMVYDGLQSVGNDLEPEPNLATSWWMVPVTDPELVASGEPYGSVWEYNLTTNANWSDGTPFTADDVVFTIDLQCNNEYTYEVIWANEPYTYFMYYAESLSAEKVRIHFFDRLTFEPKPVAFGGSLTMPIMPKHMLDQYSKAYIGFNWSGVFPTDHPIVGTGPFVAAAGLYNDWITDQNIALVRNPDYHGFSDYGKSISFDKIVLHRYYESQAMVLDLHVGVLDIAQLSPEGYLAVKDDVDSGNISSVNTFDGPKCTNYFTDIIFNMNAAGPNPARLDPFVRWAMAMATDKATIVDNYYHGLADAGSTLISPVNSFWHLDLSADERFEFNLTYAAAILELSGYVDVNANGIRECTNESMAYIEGWVPLGEPLTFELIVRNGHPEEIDTALFLEAVYDMIGIDLVIQVVDETIFPSDIYGYSYDMALWDRNSDPDPNPILFTQTKAAWNGWSENLYSDPYFEENYSNSVSALDQAERKTYVDSCQYIFYLDTACIILAYPYQTYVWRTDGFTGWGNWSADPGRSIDAYWGANPLWFDLAPVDSRPPVTEVEIRGSSGDDGWHTSPVTVYLNATDDLSGVNHTYYKLGTGPWLEYTAPFVVSANGNQTLQYYSVDRAGQEESHKTTYVMIDTPEHRTTILGLTLSGLLALVAVILVVAFLLVFVLMRRRTAPPAGGQEPPPPTQQ